MARILIADDDPEMRATLRRILESGGHTVREAGDGHAAEQADHDLPADILLVDVHMPHCDGIETLRSFRKRARPAKIVMTSNGGGCRICQVDYLPMAQRLGADATLRKPYERDEVVQTLARLLPEPALR